MAIAAAVILAAAGLSAAYVLSGPPNPCAGQQTPTGPTATTIPVASPRSYVDPTLVAAPSNTTPFVINVVAAENFWGSLVSQLGGAWTHVTSIITDPNTDPHEYQSNDSTALAFAHAEYIILNNVGYDSWGTELVAADGNSNQVVLNVGDSLGVYETGGIVTGNPHLWYNPTYVNETVAWMYHNLTTIEPGLDGYFTDQYDNLTSSLSALYDEVGQIKALFHGTVVASTESIFVYLANATGLDLVSPPAFMEAIAEGNDPPDASVVTFQCQLESGHVSVLVFNAQTVTPITTNMKAIAQENNVSVMSVTETIVPPTATFQQWMGGELNALYVALDAKVLGQ